MGVGVSRVVVEESGMAVSGDTFRKLRLPDADARAGQRPQPRLMWLDGTKKEMLVMLAQCGDTRYSGNRKIHCEIYRYERVRF